MIYAKFYGPFAELMPSKDENGFWVSENAGKKPGEVLGEFDFKGVNYITLINNVRPDDDYILKDGDKISVMPLLAGG